MLGGDRLGPLAQLHLVKARFQCGHGVGAVLVLGFFRTGHHDPGGQVGDPHRRIRGVHMLPPRARAAIGIDADFIVGHGDLDVVVNHRIHPDRRERGMPPRRTVIGRDADQPMHPRFRFQPAIGIAPVDPVSDRPDARLFARVLADQFHLIAMRLGPAHIHPRQHRSPVAAFGATGACVDLKERVVGVGLAVQQRLDFLGGGLVHQRADRSLSLGHDLGVALGLAHLDQFQIVGKARIQPPIGGHRIDQRLPLAHHLLRARRVVPQIRRLDHGVKLFQPVRDGLPVHPLGQKLQRFADRVCVALDFSAHGSPFAFHRLGARDSRSHAGVQAPCPRLIKVKDRQGRVCNSCVTKRNPPRPAHPGQQVAPKRGDRHGSPHRGGKPGCP